MDLGPLYKRAIDHYKEFEPETWLVKNSIPILYFGDIAAYSRSRLKVVTVGLNPSDAEFSKDRFGRHESESLDPTAFEQTLSGYFRTNPYREWFDPSYETLLRPIGASFYGERHQENTALHMDICTPLATNPTWSGLPLDVKSRLQATGFPLWLDLMKRLEPNLILISVGKDHLRRLDLSWRSFQPFDRASDRQGMRIAEMGESKVVWGQAQVRPFFYLKKGQ